MCVFRSGTTLARLDDGWELTSSPSSLSHGRRVRCVLTSWEAFCAALLERGIPLASALGKFGVESQAAHEYQRTLLRWLHAFVRDDPSEGEAFLFPDPPGLLKRWASRADRPFTGYRDAYPREIAWYVTRHCPQNCTYCHFFHKGSTVTERNVLPIDDVRRWAKELEFLGVGEISATGGEPFLRTDLADVISAFAQTDVRLTLFTRHPFTEREAAQMASSGLRRAYYSLDTLNPEVAAQLGYDATAIRRSIDAMRFLIKEGVQVLLSPVLMQSTLPGLQELIDVVKAVGVHSVRPIPFVCYYHDPEQAEWLLTSEQIEELAATLSGQNGSFVIDTSLMRAVVPGAFCDSGLDKLYVLPDGSYAFCPFINNDGNMIVGHVNRDTLAEVWYGDALGALAMDKRRPILKAHARQYSIKSVKPCRVWRRGRASNSSFAHTPQRV